MSAEWPCVALGDVLTHRKQFVQIDDMQSYKRCRVKLHVQGIVLRDMVPGSEIKTKKQQVCRAGEFLVAEIDAKVGGFGIVPDDLENAIVSSHYFLYQIDETKLDRRFLDYYIRTPPFREQVEAQGSTNYAAIRPADVLGYTIPLPPLPEQRRIVARVEAVAERVAEARRLREEAHHEAVSLTISEVSRVFAKLRDSSSCYKLAALLSEAGYGTSYKCEEVRPAESIPVLRIPNVIAERLSFRDLKYAPLPPPEIRKTTLLDGDILVVRTNGSAELVGRSAVVESLPEIMSFASYLIRLRPDSSRVAPQYLQRFLTFARLTGLLFDFARTTAGQYCLASVETGRTLRSG